MQQQEGAEGDARVAHPATFRGHPPNAQHTGSQTRPAGHTVALRSAWPSTATINPLGDQRTSGCSGLVASSGEQLSCQAAQGGLLLPLPVHTALCVREYSRREPLLY